MNKDESIAYLIQNEKRHRSLCRKVTGGNDLYEDLYQDCMVRMLEIHEDVYNGIQCLECFFLKIITNNWHSTTSPFYKQYRRRPGFADINELAEVNNEQYDSTIDTTANKINTLLENEYWFDRELFKLWMDEGSTRKVSAKVGIHYKQVSLAVLRIKKSLKKKSCIFSSAV